MSAPGMKVASEQTLQFEVIDFLLEKNLVRHYSMHKNAVFWL